MDFSIKKGNLEHIRGLTLVKNLLNAAIVTMFSQKKINYVIHRITHSGEKPYYCSHCDKPFAKKRKFEILTRTHTVEKFFH